MTLYRLQVFYQRGEGNKWSNVYHSNADSLATLTANFVTDMQAKLLSSLDPSCRLTKILASSTVDATFSEVSIEEVGTHFGSGTLYPLWNCVKLFFSTAGLGRPDYKYLKGFVGEDNVDSDVIDGGQLIDLVDDFQAMIDDMSSDGTPLVSNEGDIWLTCTAQPGVQMRQMHRRRKKTVAP